MNGDEFWFYGTCIQGKQPKVYKKEFATYQ